MRICATPEGVKIGPEYFPKAVLIHGVATTYTAPAEVFVPKDKAHRVIALEDHTRWWCVFVCRDEEGNVNETDDIASTT